MQKVSGSSINLLVPIWTLWICTVLFVSRVIGQILVEFFDVKLKIKYINRSLTGTPRKLLSIYKAKKYGWKTKTDIKKGLKLTFESFNRPYK